MADLEIGVLAEDDNDCEVVRVLVRRILAERGLPPGAWHLQKRAGSGCAKLRGKAERWMRELASSGCTAAVLLHDLDLNDEAKLTRELSAIPRPPELRRLICIPVEEIEAWFFSSVKILHELGGSDQKAHPSPHLITRPKERLRDMSRGANKRPRYSQNDNKTLAEDLDFTECAKRCPAFGKLHAFVLALAPSIGGLQGHVRVRARPRKG